MEDNKQQIEEMAKLIRPILENRTDVGFIPDLDKPIAEELLKHYQPKLPEDSVVISKEEFWKLSDKFSKKELDDISQFRVNKAVEEALEKILIESKQLVKKWLSRNDEKVGFIFDFEEFIKEQFGAKVREDSR